MTDVGLTFRCVLGRELEHLDSLHEHLPEAAKRGLWFYRRCPELGDDFPCLFYLLDEDGRLASSIHAIPDRLTVGGVTRRWAWTANLFTVPEARGRGLATLLQRESLQALHGLGVGRGSVFSTEVTLHIYRKLGFVVPGHARRFLMLKSARPLLAAHIRDVRLRAAAYGLTQPLVSAAARVCYSLSRLRGPRAECVAVPSSHDPVMTEVLDCLSREEVHFSTGPAQLQWKIDIANRGEGVRCVPYVLRSVPAGEPLGYAVIKTRRQDHPLAGLYKDFELMSLADFALVRRARGNSEVLLRELLALFLQNDAEVLEIISNDEAMNDAARWGGMVPVGKGMSFAFAAPGGWGFGPEMNDLGRWPLTHFSGDGFFL